MLWSIVSVFMVICATVNAQILPPTGIRRVSPGPIINTRTGSIQGQEERYDIFRRIYTFKGIRYAKAPVGELRFKAPVPVEPTIFLQKAFEEGPSCPQILVRRVRGEEDCLFLNIATPTNIRQKLPVVVSIHGGGLQIGSGSIETLGPEYLNQEGVIFVSLNYRLNVLGFLNIGDFNAPGNYGLKDIIEALRWVQDNIEYFGGDANDVTIWGISGGAVAVHSLVVSPAARGLFHKAIAHSGSLFNGWAFSRTPGLSVQKLVTNLGLSFVNNADLIRQLRAVSVVRLLEAAEISFRDMQTPSLFDELNWMPSMDPEGSLEPIIFPAPIATLVRQGNVNRVPMLVGFNSIESAATIRDITRDPTILERFNQNPHLLIPYEWNVQPGSPQATEIITTFRNLYFGGRVNITLEDSIGWMQYVSDREFIFGVSKLARLHQAQQPVFYFQFSYSGSLSWTQRILGLTNLNGAVHGDDIFHVLRMNILVTPVSPRDEAFRVARRSVRLWGNFIRFSNPTPSRMDPLIGTLSWPQMTESSEFMDIGQSLRADTSPNALRMLIWQLFDDLFNP